MTIIRDIPALAVRCGSGLARSDLSGLVSDMRVRRELSAPALCEITLRLEPDRPRILADAPLTVTVGQGRCAIFDGTVTALAVEKPLAGAPVMRLRAHDALHRLRGAQTMTMFSDMTAGEIIADIAGRHGLATDVRDDGPVLPRTAQTRQSDLDFLRDIAARAGLWFFLDGNRLVVTRAQRRGRATPLDPADNLLAFRFEDNLLAVPGGMEARQWDPTTIAHHSAAAPAPTQRPGLLGGRGGAGRVLASRTGRSRREAGAEAQAAMDRAEADRLTLEGTVTGDARLGPGVAVRLVGAGMAGDHSFVLSSVLHTVDGERGFLTEVSTRLPDAAPQAPAGEITPARVVDVADPSGLGRVRVALPVFADIETDWLQVLLPAAGRDKGVIALPDFGDTVLVALVNGDPAQGVVLGGVFGSEAPDDTGVSGGRRCKLLMRSGGGHEVVLDDAKDRIVARAKGGATLSLARDETRVEAANGSYVEMTSGGMVLHAETDLQIRAPGREVRIGAAKVDFEKL
ncbi:hypothetical protein DEA8626_03349 [Defluviimonas aquaemixtae]|uniref:Gp5/Type VI secretion system Vgr protein OB-fold domain-containing protein n=1 Tax=Albidovulum aquaemixtae TaxID=1542388 RepID=A0A2R8BLJ6_9RHOB|nr:contractile injection system protein, VgrG/Pvc8 family [Defluviimonas aquaemixtae]SPH24299.1 hypothetical protein DEA8626_03349 [Defluviimonas aquaemixtae]